MEELNLNDYDAEILSNDKETANFFEEVVHKRDPKFVTSWITGELFSYLKKIDKTIIESNVTPEQLGNFIDLIIDGVISNRQAKEVFEDYIRSKESAKDFIKKKGISSSFR